MMMNRARQQQVNNNRFRTDSGGKTRRNRGGCKDIFHGNDLP